MITADKSRKASYGARDQQSKSPQFTGQKSRGKELKNFHKTYQLLQTEFMLGSEISVSYSFKLLQLTESHSCRDGPPHVALEVAPLPSTDQQPEMVEVT